MARVDVMAAAQMARFIFPDLLSVCVDWYVKKPGFGVLALIHAFLVTNLVVGGMKVRAMHKDSDAWEYALSYLQIASWSLSLGTNFFATLAIAWKAWYIPLPFFLLICIHAGQLTNATQGIPPQYQREPGRKQLAHPR